MSQRVNSTSTASFTADTAILQLDGYSKFSYWRTANVIMPSLQQALLQPLRDLLPQLHAVHMATDFINYCGEVLAADTNKTLLDF